MMEIVGESNKIRILFLRGSQNSGQSRIFDCMCQKAEE